MIETGAALSILSSSEDQNVGTAGILALCMVSTGTGPSRCPYRLSSHRILNNPLDKPTPYRVARSSRGRIASLLCSTQKASAVTCEATRVRLQLGGETPLVAYEGSRSRKPRVATGSE